MLAEPVAKLKWRRQGALMTVSAPPALQVSTRRGFALCLVLGLAPSAAHPEGVATAVDSPALEVIVVTARKVDEDLQDVPMAVQVLSGALLETLDLTRLTDLQFNVPGLVVNTLGMWGAGFSLRGVTDQGSGQSVATHFNGVYQASSNLAIAHGFDLERIEVLKGPQGTLYGRNATGGSINFITRPADRNFSAETEVARASFETTRAHGHVNGPVGDAAVRFAFIASEGDGYIRNSVDSRRFAEDDYWGVRGSLRLEPDDRVRVDIVGQHIEDDGATGELWGKRPDQLIDPSDIRLTTVTLENPYLETQNDSVDAKVVIDLGRATLHSITGYARSEVHDVDDCAGVPILQGCVRSADPLIADQVSQEFQLVLRDAGPVQAIVGANYFAGESRGRFRQHIPVVNDDPLTDGHTNTEETATALFGQATLDVADRWSVTGGLRLSREKHREVTSGHGVNDSPTPVERETDSDDVSWRLDVANAVSDELMLYASIATGYKSGGFGDYGTYGPENLVAYEAGGKSRWLDGRLTLNGALFYYDFDDLQVATVMIRDGAVVSDIDNAARAQIVGVDAEGRFSVTEHLSLAAGLVWLPTREYVDYESEVTGDTLSGNELVRAPELSTTAAIEYARPVGHLGTAWTRVEYHYRSSHYYTKENDPLFAQDGFGLLNLYLRFDSASQRWYAFASGRNLTKEDYFNQVFLQSSPGYPDTYELGIGWRF
jgi:iron complex outermembrane receptor protein